MSFKKLSILFSFMIFFLYTGLTLSLLYFFKPDLFIKTLFSERTIFSIRLSLLAATLATLLSVFFALPSAYALSRFNFKGKNIIDTILELPMIVSPAALGAMILIFFNNPVGLWIQEKGFQVVFTIYGIIFAQFVTTVGIATRLLKTAIDEIPKRYEDVARSLGASPIKAFYTVTLPLAKRGVFAASILTWAKALGEFGATIMVAGTMVMKTETLPIAIFMRLSTAEIEGAMILILLLISLGLGILYGIRIIHNGR